MKDKILALLDQGFTLFRDIVIHSAPVNLHIPTTHSGKVKYCPHTYKVRQLLKELKAAGLVVETYHDKTGESIFSTGTNRRCLSGLGIGVGETEQSESEAPRVRTLAR